MHWLFDERTGCWSVLTSLSIRDYLELVREAHAAQGALAGQRSVLTTTSARRIRERLVTDIKAGAVLPPIVIGTVANFDDFGEATSNRPADIDELFGSEPELSIIDGMQRTTALQEALRARPEIGDRDIRVELWLADNVRALIYRMLVLNTGQVPWTMNRQLAVVYDPLLQDIIRNVPDLEKVSTPDKPGRRVKSAQYSSEHIIELYIAFSLRKPAVDTKEAVSDEFSKLDFVENVSSAEFQEQFYAALQMLARFDKAIGRYQEESGHPLSKGRQVFDRQPARIGFIVAVGMAILGRPGADRDETLSRERIQTLKTSLESLLDHLNGMSQDDLGDYLRLDVLRELLDRRVGQVGRYERTLFTEAFKVLVNDDFQTSNLESCWRAH